jgi:WD40 repeat protein
MNSTIRLTAAAVAGVTLALIGYQLLVAPSVDSQRDRLPPVVDPARNGLIAYSFDGDIFVGDPTSGETTVIVSGPDSHTNPIFSPDGTRIAFIRGDPLWSFAPTAQVDASIVVVRVDGSDERVVMPMGFSKRGVGPFAWTPDSASLVVEHDSLPYTTPYFDGELSLFDASGTAEPLLLTPPLPTAVGAMYFNASAQVAPMFQPPAGDRILSRDSARHTLSVIDVDGSRRTVLIGPSEDEVEFGGGGVWSPDGSKIVFDGIEKASGTGPAVAPAREDFHTYVINADGSDLRAYEYGWSTKWAPDGSSLAFERRVPDESSAVIVIIDLESDAERALEATTAEKKVGSEFHNMTFNTHHTWFYEGWTWTPDGRSIMVLERPGTRPFSVDIETGQVTELPWEAHSTPSWQRVPID